MFDRYTPCGLEEFCPLQTEDAPLPPPEHIPREKRSSGTSWQDILSHFHIDDVQPGDFLLLGLFVFLLRSKADEELLIALGLLLIL